MIFGFLIRFKESRFSYLSSLRLISLTGLSLLLLLSCLTVGEVSAATYYVAKTGNDSNVGSATAPFKTIQKAAAIVNPGDTVIVKDGTYTDTYAPGFLLYLTRGGNASNWITFKSENKWGAIIDGQNINECITFVNNNASYISIEDFEIKNCTSGIMGVSTPVANNNSIIGNRLHHIKYYGIDFGGDYYTIDGNIIYDIYEPYPERNQYHAIYVDYDADNTTITNNIIYDVPYGWPIHLYSGSTGSQQNTKIINNTISDANPIKDGNIIIATTSPDLLIQNNIFYNPTNAAIRAYSNNNGQNIIVRNNITNVGSMCSDTYCSGLTFTNNQTGTNPSFADAANRDYHLQSNSPAINAGLYYAGRSSDADGKPIVGVPDIGAYEYVGTDITDTTPPAAPKLY